MSETPDLTLTDAIREFEESRFLPDMCSVEALEDFRARLRASEEDPRYKRLNPWVKNLPVKLRRKLEDKTSQEQNEWKEYVLDETTGLVKRPGFMETARYLVEVALQEGFNLAYGITDIDNFKKFNDTHGHLVGDEILGVNGASIKTVLRKTDLAGRVGGEENEVILLGTSKADAYHPFDRMRLEFKSRVCEYAREKGLDISGTPGSITVGVSGLFDDLWHDQDLLRNAPSQEIVNRLREKADERLYRGKNRGKDMVINGDY